VLNPTVTIRKACLMTSSAIQLIVLAGIAIFLVLKLRNVLGTREGYEKPVMQRKQITARDRHGLEVIEGGPDRDIVDHVAQDSPAAKSLRAMKARDPDFIVGDFLNGARGAYEMILMAFEKGDLESIRPFLSPEVHDAFAEVVAAREERGLTVEAEFIGIRELTLQDAEFDETTREGEITLRVVGELASVVRDADGNIVEGKSGEIKRQKDVWTFARKMGSGDPNWRLVATGE